MARYVVVNNRTGVVEATVEYDGGPGWSPPEGFSAHQYDMALGPIDRGWPWNNGQPINPNPPPPQTEMREMTKRDAFEARTGLTIEELKKELGF